MFGRFVSVSLPLVLMESSVNSSMDRWIGEWCSYNVATGSFHTKEILWQTFFSTKVEFYWQNSKIAFCATLWGLGYTVHLWLVGKRVIDFLLVLIELFSPALMVEALWTDIYQNCGFWKRVGHFES